MDIKLDPEAVQSLAAAAILQNLDQEARDSVMKQAISGLLAPEKAPYYGGSPGQTPLQRAFDLAISQAAMTVVREAVTNDPRVKAEIEKLLGPMVQTVLNSESGRYDDTLATHIGNAVGQWLADVARERN